MRRPERRRRAERVRLREVGAREVGDEEVSGREVLRRDDLLARKVPQDRRLGCRAVWGVSAHLHPCYLPQKWEDAVLPHLEAMKPGKRRRTLERGERGGAVCVCVLEQPEERLGGIAPRGLRLLCGARRSSRRRCPRRRRRQGAARAACRGLCCPCGRLDEAARCPEHDGGRSGGRPLPRLSPAQVGQFDQHAAAL